MTAGSQLDMSARETASRVTGRRGGDIRPCAHHDLPTPRALPNTELLKVLKKGFWTQENGEISSEHEAMALRAIPLACDLPLDKTLAHDTFVPLLP